MPIAFSRPARRVIPRSPPGDGDDEETRTALEIPCHSDPALRERNLALVRKQCQIPRFALSKITPDTSFPRKRESICRTHMDPRLRGGDETAGFYFNGRAAGPCTLGMTAEISE